MRNKKSRRLKPATLPDWMKTLALDILSGTLSGLITAAVLKLFGW